MGVPVWCDWAERNIIKCLFEKKKKESVEVMTADG